MKSLIPFYEDDTIVEALRISKKRGDCIASLLAKMCPGPTTIYTLTARSPFNGITPLGSVDDNMM